MKRRIAAISIVTLACGIGAGCGFLDEELFNQSEAVKLSNTVERREVHGLGSVSAGGGHACGCGIGFGGDGTGSSEVAEEPEVVPRPPEITGTGAALLEAGGGDVKRRRAGERIYRDRCARDNGRICEVLLKRLRRGLAARMTYESLADRLGDECRHREPAGACAALADLHELGVGVPRDRERAETLESQACDAGHRPACEAKPSDAP